MKSKPKPAGKKPGKKPASTDDGTRRFAVAAAYTGECCASPHVWIAIMRAADATAAEQAMRKRVTAKQFDCSDVIAVPVSAKTKVPPTQPAHHVTAPPIATPAKAKVKAKLSGRANGADKQKTKPAPAGVLGSRLSKILAAKDGTA